MLAILSRALGRGTGADAANGERGPRAETVAPSVEGAVNVPVSSPSRSSSGLNTTPRSALTPRSLLSTPRSLLATPRSLLSSQREKWAAAKAAQEELYLRFNASVHRDELRRLTRKQLRRRLQALDSAPTEGEGLTFGALVDDVLLWNALARLHDGCEFADQEEALAALRDSRLPLDLLERALMVIGLPEGDRRGLTKETAALALYRNLRLLLGSGGGEEVPVVVTVAGEEACDGAPIAPEAVVLDESARDAEAAQLARNRKFEAFDAELARIPEEEVSAPALSRWLDGMVVDKAPLASAAPAAEGAGDAAPGDLSPSPPGSPVAMSHL
mmetsp:Transcript_54158/g.122491  ORF Transcript_54158/g.122491 Transcript_54158/m.122491 type:complete len:329 (+) Transcript_54158:36-1022(+)